eukprot:ctg_1640.g307
MRVGRALLVARALRTVHLTRRHGDRARVCRGGGGGGQCGAGSVGGAAGSRRAGRAVWPLWAVSRWPVQFVWADAVYGHAAGARSAGAIRMSRGGLLLSAAGRFDAGGGRTVRAAERRGARQRPRGHASAIAGGGAGCRADRAGVSHGGQGVRRGACGGDRCERAAVASGAISLRRGRGGVRPRGSIGGGDGEGGATGAGRRCGRRRRRCRRGDRLLRRRVDHAGGATSGGQRWTGVSGGYGTGRDAAAVGGRLHPRGGCGRCVSIPQHLSAVYRTAGQRQTERPRAHHPPLERARRTTAAAGVRDGPHWGRRRHQSDVRRRVRDPSHRNTTAVEDEPP